MTATRAPDAIVVGAGHNGLTAAAFPSRAGLAVTVLERRYLAGSVAHPGGAVTGAAGLLAARAVLEDLA